VQTIPHYKKLALTSYDEGHCSNSTIGQENYCIWRISTGRLLLNDLELQSLQSLRVPLFQQAGSIESGITRYQRTDRGMQIAKTIFDEATFHVLLFWHALVAAALWLGLPFRKD